MPTRRAASGRCPAWLKGKCWDNPEVVEAYRRLCIWLFGNSDSLDLLSVAFGNEVDALLGDSCEDWKAYINFATAAAVEAGARHPQLMTDAKTTFAAWDKHASQIGFLNFVWLNDIGDAELKEYLKYYGVDAICFAEFLGTLGLRHDGAAKPAFETLVEEARKRGW